MKTLIVTLSLIVISLLSACKKSAWDDTVPVCIRNDIEANKNNDYWGIVSVEEYEFQGTLVYAFKPDNRSSDAQTPVLRTDCTSLCDLGGITGNSMCNGDQFSDKAVYKRTIWQK